jgi:beta-glucosidase
LAEGVPLPIPETAFGSGLKAEFFANPDFSGAPVHIETQRKVDFDWNRIAPAPGLNASRYGVRWTGTLTPEGPGEHLLRVDVPRCFDCSGHDAVRLWVDGQQVVADDGDNSKIEARLTFADTRPRAIRLELAHASEDEGIRLTWTAPANAQRQAAVAAAQAADAVIAFVGLSPAVEGEALQIEVAGFSGGDRTDIALPETQQALLEAVKATGKPLIVVLLSGSAVAMEWAKTHADAVVAAWYPGEAGGTAIADLVDGTINPAGRLPVTFYARTRDLPAFVDYNMRERTYRYFHGTPLWGFGHGLSYSRFTYSDAVAPATVVAGGSISVTARISNMGARDGEEVAQLYLTPPEALTHIGDFNDPVLRHSLVAFDRVPVGKGKSRTVRFTLDPRALSTVDRDGVRAVRPGSYTLFVGGGQPGETEGATMTFTISGTQVLPK